jgi:hypothetical protein
MFLFLLALLHFLVSPLSLLHGATYNLLGPPIVSFAELRRVSHGKTAVVDNYRLLIVNPRCTKHFVWFVWRNGWQARRGGGGTYKWNDARCYCTP